MTPQWITDRLTALDQDFRLAEEYRQEMELDHPAPDLGYRHTLRVQIANRYDPDTVRKLLTLLAEAHDCLDRVSHELGVPGPDYPAPVTNAVELIADMYERIEAGLEEGP